MLAWTIYISFLGVAVLMCLPRESARAVKLLPTGMGETLNLYQPNLRDAQLTWAPSGEIRKA